MQEIAIGVLCLERTTFDYRAATELFEKVKAELRKDASVRWEIIEDPIMEADEAVAAGKLLAAKGLDGVAIISGTFHLGHLALLIDKYVNKPILLWAFPELPYNGGKIRLNSVCGINLNASNLYKAGVDHYTCRIGETIDQDWINALRMRAKLSEARVGLAGYRADGFFNLDVEDLSVFRNLKVLIDHYELKELYEGEVNLERCKEFEEYIRRRFNICCVTEKQIGLVARLAASMEHFLQKNRLDALAIRCWPEFAANYGVAPCAAMALLTAKGYTLGCEGDVEGTLSLLACRALSEEAPFMADLSQVDLNNDYALMWHCGVASDTLWDGRSDLALDTYFAGGKGVTTDFVMKQGDVTIFRIDTARGKTRVFLQKGSALPMEKQLKGTYAKVRFDLDVGDLFAAVAEHGVAHHVAMLYGDHTGAIRQFAKIMGYEVLP